MLALAATLAVAAGGAIVAGELGGSSESIAVGTTTGVPEFSADVRRSEVAGSLGALPTDASDDYQEKAAAPESEAATNQTEKRSSIGDITTGARLADLHATLLLQVGDRDQLSERTAQAMKIARSVSGYVVSADVNAPKRGVATSYLMLKIPAKRSQEALAKFSELGKILSQEISLEDVQQAVNQQGKQITGLKNEIESLVKALEDPTLTDEARSQLQVKLANDRAKLSSLRVQRKQNIIRGRLATVELTFTTGELPQAPAEPSRIHKAVDRAWDGLSSEISWAAMVLIVSSPFLLLAIVLGGGFHIRRRREERRLLEK